MIGHIEAAIEDEELKKAATRVTQMIDTVEDWLDRRLSGTLNQITWNKSEEIRDWMKSCRLDAPRLALSQLDPEDGEKMQVLGRVRELTAPAIENMKRLLAKEEVRAAAAS